MQAGARAGAAVAACSRSHTAEGVELSGGIRALAMVAAISTVATLLMTATTASHIAWPNGAFQLLGIAIIAAVVVAHARRVSTAQLAFMAGVLAASLPSLATAGQHWLDHWDDFMTWLPNAVYVWKMGGLPTVAAPPAASDLPGYPPGSSIVLAAIWSLAGRVVDDAGPVLNVLCLMVLPGVILRGLDLRFRPSGLQVLGLGAILGLAATVLNVGVDWHWVLSSLPEVATLVALAAAFVLAAECLLWRSANARGRLAALAAILALVVNLKQTGLAPVGILMVSAAAAAWICREPDRRDFREAALTVALVALPSAAVWLCWRVYLTDIFPAHAVAFRPLGQWYYALLPALFGGIADRIAENWLFFAPLAIVVARGWFVLGRSLAAGGPATLSAGDRLAAIFALVETLYVGFLIVCYIGAFNDEEVPRAAEFVRYQAEVGGAGLVAAVVLAVERLRQPLSTALMPAILALQLGAVWLLQPAAGVYQYGGVLPASEIESVRQLGREAGRLVAGAQRPIDVTMVVSAHPLAYLVMRYEMWASAPTQIVRVKVTVAEGESAAFADLVSAAHRAVPAVALIEGSQHCGFYADGAHVDLLPASKASAACRSMLQPEREDRASPVQSGR